MLGGVTGLALERSDGKTTRTIPIVDTTVSSSIGHVNFTLRGGCSGYIFAEAKPLS